MIYHDIYHNAVIYRNIFMQHAFISTSYRYAHKKYQSQLTSSSTIRLEVANHNTPTVNTTSRSTEMLSRSQNNPKPWV